ncbi:hypothetical protein B0H63DRAFT_304866 [Podospora didyma]|uniref:Zn(2)-C6 fungal-type domain-containing protein n=1 Tax=Podospora didyma TaxID=330526 RepID=A0AAE0K4K7_9PEZI|nr:hypothetical protein B0H63DRAFT_304866 [Podospora didyma]
MLTFSHLSADSFESHLKAGRKRPRVREAVSCWQCRTRKIRCDREAPCKQCQDRGVPNDCHYTNSRDRLSAQPRSPRPSKKASPAPSRTPSRTPSRSPAPTSGPVQTPVQQIHTPPDSSSSSRGETPEPSSDIQVPQEPLHALRGNAFQGSACKTRIIGLSHWMAPCNDMTVVKAMLDRSTEFYASRKAFSELKAVIRARNVIHTIPTPAASVGASSLRALLPHGDECESWMAQYFRTYGRIYSVVEADVLTRELERIRAGTLDNPVHISKILMVAAIAMQQDETQRLRGRQLARAVEDAVHAYSRFQKPCIGVVQVLLLLIILKTIAASDTDKMYELLALQGLVTQIVSSMGLHRDPALFSEVTPYYAEVRKRLWASFLRLNLDYCLRSGTQFSLRLDESDCSLPTPTVLRRLDPEMVNSPYEMESDKQYEADMAFNIAAVKLVKIIAPAYQALYSAHPPDSYQLQKNIRASFSALLSDLPLHLRGSTTFDPVQELQQSLLSIPMHSFLSILAVGSTMGTRTDDSQRSQLMGIWDDASAVLHQFQRLTKHTQETNAMACHFLWSDAGRAALTACLIVGKLRRLDHDRIIRHPQHTVCVFQQMLTNTLSNLSTFWHGKFHLGPVAAKLNLILAVILNVTMNLASGDYHPDTIQQILFDDGVATADRLIADMKAALQPQPRLQPPSISVELVTTPSSADPSPDSAVFTTWPADSMAFLTTGPPSNASSAASSPFLEFLAMDFSPALSFSSLQSNLNFSNGGYLEDPTLSPLTPLTPLTPMTSFNDHPSMDSIWE